MLSDLGCNELTLAAVLKEQEQGDKLEAFAQIQMKPDWLGPG